MIVTTDEWRFALEQCASQMELVFEAIKMGDHINADGVSVHDTWPALDNARKVLAKHRTAQEAIT